MVNKKDCNTPGERIAFARDLMGYKQVPFAEKLDITRGYLAKIETGDKNVSRNILERLKDTFGINADWVLTGEGAMRPIEAKPVELKVEIPTPTVGDGLQLREESSPYKVASDLSKELEQLFPKLTLVDQIEMVRQAKEKYKAVLYDKVIKERDQLDQKALNEMLKTIEQLDKEKEELFKKEVELKQVD